MAKVMISMPDDLLGRLDARARQRGTSRSGLLRLLAEQELAVGDDQRQARLAELLSRPGHYGGTSAREIRKLRESR
jgi:metal-responsive CopG/Arc/MetJ family transcriptional regulator